METNKPSSELRKAAVTNGVIWAIINITLFLLVFYVKPNMMGEFLWVILQILIGIGLAVYFCLDLRKKAGGYWSFKVALSSIFVMFLVPAVIVFFFTIVFGKYLEPSYAENMTKIMNDTTIKMYEKMGMDQEQIDEAVEKNEAVFEKQFNPGLKEIIFGLGSIVIMYFIGALIFAAIFKKDPPLFAQQIEE